MQIVIDVQEEDYEELSTYIRFADNHSGRLLKAIRDGVPLNINRLLDEKEQDEIEERIWKMVKEKIKEEGDKRYQDGFETGRKYQVDWGGEI